MRGGRRRPVVLTERIEPRSSRRWSTAPSWSLSQSISSSKRSNDSATAGGRRRPDANHRKRWIAGKRCRPGDPARRPRREPQHARRLAARVDRCARQPSGDRRGRADLGLRVAMGRSGGVGAHRTTGDLLVVVAHYAVGCRVDGGRASTSTPCGKRCSNCHTSVMFTTCTSGRSPAGSSRSQRMSRVLTLRTIRLS